MDNIPEKRKQVRIKEPYITHFRVKIRDDTVSKEWDTVSIVDMSAGGIFFYSSTNFKVGTILDLEISFSRSYPTVKCAGKVLRVGRYLDASRIGYAIEFAEINEQIKKMINKSLEITKRQQEL
jgi:hypothetical protein